MLANVPCYSWPTLKKKKKDKQNNDKQNNNNKKKLKVMWVGQTIHLPGLTEPQQVSRGLAGNCHFLDVIILNIIRHDVIVFCAFDAIFQQFTRKSNSTFLKYLVGQCFDILIMTLMWDNDNELQLILMPY